jgi:hypothetical protein
VRSVDRIVRGDEVMLGGTALDKAIDELAGNTSLWKAPQ